MLQGITWAMLYLWTQNYSQIIGTCPGHHGQLISQNCVLTKIRVEPPPTPPLNREICLMDCFPGYCLDIAVPQCLRWRSLVRVLDL